MACSCNTCRNSNCSCNCSCTNRCTCRTSTSCGSTDTCGGKQTKSNLVFLKGIDEDCIDFAFNGKTLTVGFNKLIETICNLETPSGYTFIVESCNSNIIVTQEVAGDQVIYTVCLDPDVITQIVNNTTNISTLDACVLDTVKDVISSDGSINVAVSSSNDCGRTIDLTVINPSGCCPVYEGIVYNNITKDGTNGLGGTQTLKTFSRNYVTNNILADGDEIRYRVTGQLTSGAGVADSIIIELYDVNTATVVDSTTFSGFNTAGSNSFVIDGVITADVTNGDALHSIECWTNAVVNGTDPPSNYTHGSTTKINQDVTGIDFAPLTINVKFINNSGSSASDNFARQLMVEVVKKI